MGKVKTETETGGPLSIPRLLLLLSIDVLDMTCLFAVWTTQEDVADMYSLIAVPVLDGLT